MITVDNIKTNVQDMTKTIVEPGRQVWLAGLGVVATVGGEVKHTFDRLVERGESYDTETIKRTKKTKEGVMNRVNVIKDKIDDRIQHTIQAGLGRIGLSTHEEIQMLIKRLEQLTKKVDTLQTKV